MIADCYSTQELLKLLGITQATLRRWLTGRSSIPWAASQLALEHSHYGLAERDSAEGFNRAMLTGLNQALRNRISWLEQELVNQARLTPWACANDPFISPSDPRSSW